MPRRDGSEGVNGDASPETDSNETEEPDGTERGEEGIEVEESGSLGEPAVDADPIEEMDEYLVEVAELSVADPVAAGDEIGTLLSIAREEDGDRFEDASLILEHLGDVRPEEFAVWTESLEDLAGSLEEDLAFLGLRSLAQLGAANPQAAKAGLDPALAALSAADPRRRRAALSLVAEVGSADPGSVKSADGSIAAALADGDPETRIGAAMAAGRLLAADPASFPRTATALLDTLYDEDDRVSRYAHVALANFALDHPEQVPEKARAIEALANATDRELGLREGATDEALSALLEFVDVR